LDWTAAQTISNIILVTILIIVTIYYAIQTAKQVKIMRENLRYERLIKEMDALVGPLYSILDDNTAPYLTLVYHSQETAPRFHDIHPFWRDIKKNIYLSPRDLRESLKNYLDVRQDYRRTRVDRTTPGEEQTAAKALFDQAIEDLKPKIKDRYDALSDQLAECERKME
jgi:hypothetical protein